MALDARRPRIELRQGLLVPIMLSSGRSFSGLGWWSSCSARGHLLAPALMETAYH
jgi:hypothetical protein